MGGAFRRPGAMQRAQAEVNRRSFGIRSSNMPQISQNERFSNTRPFGLKAPESQHQQVKAQIPANATSTPIVEPSGPAVAPASVAKNVPTESVAVKGYQTPQTTIFPTVTAPQNIEQQPFAAPVSNINQLTPKNQATSFKLPDTSNLRFGGS